MKVLKNVLENFRSHHIRFFDFLLTRLFAPGSSRMGLRCTYLFKMFCLDCTVGGGTSLQKWHFGVTFMVWSQLVCLNLKWPMSRLLQYLLWYQAAKNFSEMIYQKELLLTACTSQEWKWAWAMPTKQDYCSFMGFLSKFSTIATVNFIWDSDSNGLCYKYTSRGRGTPLSKQPGCCIF